MASEAAIAAEIVPENIRATEAIYSSSMLENLKLFQVADSLVAAFQNGMLPIKRSSARGLYHYWREGPQRLTASERRNLYTRVLGTPGGDEGVIPNRDFHDLWVRFVSSVSELEKRDPGDLEAQVTRIEETRASGRELALNLSLHGYGVAYFAANELQKQINQIVKLLADSEIQKAYGAQDVWHVVDQIANLELGGARDSVRYRTLASSGANIIAWLAKNARKFSISGRGQLLNLKKPIKSGTDSSVSRVSKSPDNALINACEQWLAVSGISDDSVNARSQPNQ